MAHKIEEFPIFQAAVRFCRAVTEILKGSRLHRNSNTYKQIEEANDSILANMSEGFAQESDDGFARYLYYSKGSVAEVIRRLKQAAERRLADGSAIEQLEPMAEELRKQYGGLIKYLKRCRFKDRGRYLLEHTSNGTQAGDPDK